MGLTLAGSGVVGGLDVPAPGLVLIDSQSFTAQSSVSFDGVFTSAYDNYRIVYRATHSASDWLNFRVRASSTDLTSATYKWQTMTGSGGSVSGYQDAAASLIQVIIMDASAEATAVMDVTSPFAAAKTQALIHATGYYSAVPYMSYRAAVVNDTTAYDGFTFYPASGTITGTIWVYGYNDVVGDAAAYSTPPQSGLELVTSSTFSAASSVSVDGCFTSAYDAYRVIFSFTGSADVAVSMRLRAASTDNSASTYYSYGNYATWAAAGGNQNVVNGGTAAEIGFSGAPTIFMDMYGPALAAETRWQCPMVTTNYRQLTSGKHGTASAFDGFTFYPASGTITGTVTVYGYAKGA